MVQCDRCRRWVYLDETDFEDTQTANAASFFACNLCGILEALHNRLRTAEEEVRAIRHCTQELERRVRMPLMKTDGDDVAGPEPSLLIQPGDGQSAVGTSAPVEVHVSTPEGDAAGSDPEFTASAHLSPADGQLDSIESRSSTSRIPEAEAKCGSQGTQTDTRHTSQRDPRRLKPQQHGPRSGGGVHKSGDERPNVVSPGTTPEVDSGNTDTTKMPAGKKHIGSKETASEAKAELPRPGGGHALSGQETSCHPRQDAKFSWSGTETYREWPEPFAASCELRTG